MENQKIIDKIYEDAVIGLSDDILADGDKWYNYVMKLPQEQQLVYTIGILNIQIQNGGLHQYFFNGYGQFAFVTIRNLEVIGANKMSLILKEATRLVNYEGLEHDEFRERVFNRDIDKLKNFEDNLAIELDSLDDQFYECSDDLEKLLVKYLR